MDIVRNPPVALIGTLQKEDGSGARKKGWLFE